MVINEFSGTREKIFETDGIKNIDELEDYALSRGFIFSKHTMNNHQYIELKKGTVSITVPFPPFENELSMSMLIGSIREQLTKAKH